MQNNLNLHTDEILVCTIQDYDILKYEEPTSRTLLKIQSQPKVVGRYIHTHIDDYSL
jgi:hypothetical protein